jgi:hypothetical protein
MGGSATSTAATASQLACDPPRPCTASSDGASRSADGRSTQWVGPSMSVHCERTFGIGVPFPPAQRHHRSDRRPPGGPATVTA